MYGALYRRVLVPVHERVIKRSHLLDRLAFVQQSQWWSRDRLFAFQRAELRRLIHHAYEQVPYWRSVFERLKLTPGDIEREEDLRKLPVSTKDTMRAHRADLVAVGWRGRTWTKATGGSTGEPLEFEYTPQSQDWRVAVSKRGYEWAGCVDGVKQAYLWGVPVGRVPAWRRLKETLHHRIARQRYFNSFELSEAQIARCQRALNLYQPDVIDG